MNIQSMTGFARTTGVAAGRSFSWEIRAVNGRSLDIKLRTPPGFDSIGEEARKRLSGKLARGTIHITLTIAAADGPKTLSINIDALNALVSAVSSVSLPPGVSGASLDGLLSMRGVVEHGEEDQLAQLEAMQPSLLKAFGEAENAFLESRKAEGKALLRVLNSQLDQIDSLTQSAAHHPSRNADAIKARISSQVALLLEASNQLDGSRLHQEAALLATKADIREEIDRLDAHIVSAREMMAAGGPVGRRLDFLAQEFGRESSTLCAKANDVALSRIGLELRAIIDQLREQVQNVE